MQATSAQTRSVAAQSIGATLCEAQDENPDLDLIRRTAAGDLHAFTALMRRHNQKLYRATRSILLNEAEAEEAVQEAWWKAYQHLEEFRGQAQPSTWLTRIAVNEALMRRRSNKSRAEIVQPVADLVADEEDSDAFLEQQSGAESDQPDQAAQRSELRELIEREIDRLPEMYRSVFMLCGIDHMSAKDAAHALGLSQVTVRVRFMRARRMLQTALSREIDPHSADAFSFAGHRCDRIVAGVHEQIRITG